MPAANFGALLVASYHALGEYAAQPVPGVYCSGAK